MAFMELQSEFGVWYLVEGRWGTDLVPADACGDLGLEVGQDVTSDDVTPERWAEIVHQLRDFVEGPTKGIQEVSCVEKWGCRYSAPGYMDATDWVLGDTQEEAERDCREMYGDDEEESDDES